MRFGINTFLFTFPFTNASTRWFKTFKQWGFDTVEIAIDDPKAFDPVLVKKALDKAGLACGSACGCFGLDRDLRGNARAQKNSMDYVKACLDHMVVLDCPSFIGPVYSAVGRAAAVEPADSKRQWATVVRNLSVLCRYAEARGKQICIEPLNRFETDFINTCEQALQMLKAVGSPALKVHLDTFHMNIEEKSQGDAIRRAGKHLGHFHACGSDRGTPGNDHIDWDGIAKALHAIGYQGDVVIESFTKDVEIIAKAAAIWRKIEPSQRDIAVKGLKFLKQTLA
ncbi:MAG: sugar phosphate isomerase/epimerase [Verrucomicrobia bacterium]|nr:sugar phosphate isomerase/epimerase [Verrucomicrobiota bacterium]